VQDPFELEEEHLARLALEQILDLGRRRIESFMPSC